MPHCVTVMLLRASQLHKDDNGYTTAVSSSVTIVIVLWKMACFFRLPLFVAATLVTIKMLKWNCSSDLLAALVRCENYECLKIWFFSNNHWYLKQEVWSSDNLKQTSICSFTTV